MASSPAWAKLAAVNASMKTTRTHSRVNLSEDLICLSPGKWKFRVAEALPRYLVLFHSATESRKNLVKKLFFQQDHKHCGRWLGGDVNWRPPVCLACVHRRLGISD